MGAGRRSRARPPEWVRRRRAPAPLRVDVGNPHLVLALRRRRAAAAPIDLVAIGEPGSTAQSPGGANVEFVAARRPTATSPSRVYERGVGPTQACGTGACAAAAAARDWGLAGDQVTVHMPGGPVEIALGDPVLLTGDAVVARAARRPTWP